MQNIFKLAAVTAICTSAAAAQAAVGFDANLELDTTFTNGISAPATNPRVSDVAFGGRVELNATATAKSGDNFVTGKGTLLIKKDQTTGVDDMWIQFGNAAVDMKLGAFEATDLFPVGKDTVLEEAGGYGGYKANTLRGRFKSGSAVHGALGFNAAPGLRLELGLVHTNTDGGTRGLRPVMTYTTGPLTLRAGIEAIQINQVTAVAAVAAVPGNAGTAAVAAAASSTATGFGLSAGYAINKDASININFAKKDDDRSFGLNGQYGPAGLGLVISKGLTAVQETTTVYAAYSFPLLGIAGASITPAVSFSKGGTGTADQSAFRLRFNYSF